MNEEKEERSALVFNKKPHVMVVEADFYKDISNMLFMGAMSVLDANGITYDRFFVPGALEIPACIEFGILSGRFDAFVALGCVIRGETTHYEIVSGESARALMDQTIKHHLCLGNGILTVENKEQAIERADPLQLNKGGGAAHAALSMYALKEKLGRRF